MLITREKIDLQLREDVESALETDPSLNAATIGVAVTEGVVTLTGRVSTYWQKVNAERDVERIARVRGIVNEVEVHTASERTDTDIATAAVEALDRNSQVPADRITVRVTNGWATLTGRLQHDFQRRAAHRTVRDIDGVKGVLNDIDIDPPIQVADIKDKISKAFERQAFIDASHIAVSVEGHTVYLHGAVKSWAERRQAENVAAAASGVTAVQNRIEVVS
jgi:osmotically-inducible protein OsmY